MYAAPSLLPRTRGTIPPMPRRWANPARRKLFRARARYHPRVGHFLRETGCPGHRVREKYTREPVVGEKASGEQELLLVPDFIPKRMSMR